jgi:hypothetical protein
MFMVLWKTRRQRNGVMLMLQVTGMAVGVMFARDLVMVVGQASIRTDHSKK